MTTPTAQQLTSFANTLAGNRNDGISATVTNNAIHDAQQLADLFYVAADAGPSKADYQRTADAVQLDEAATRMETALAALQHALQQLITPVGRHSRETLSPDDSRIKVTGNDVAKTTAARTERGALLGCEV